MTTALLLRRRAAVAAAARGWRVFPLRPNDKRPAVRDWETRATTDLDRIHHCWAAGPWNIGIACGPSGLVVIDLDTPKPGDTAPPAWQLPGVTCGEDVLAVLADRAGAPMPYDTHTVRTGRGGRHLYFAPPADARLRNTAGRLGWLIDTRAHGGYVVAAGSAVHTRPYVTEDDRPPAPLPDWLAAPLTDPPGGGTTGTAPRPTLGAVLDDADRRSGYLGAALRGEIDRVTHAGPGSRNQTLNTAAYNLGQLIATDLLPRQVVVDALTAAALSTGLGPAETATTIRSGLHAGAANPRKVPA
jgi:hypothetical protein